MSRALWIVGLLVGAMMLPMSCIGGIVVLERLSRGSVDGQLQLDGITARPDAVRCRDGRHLQFTGVNIIAEDWTLDVVQHGDEVAAYLRTPKLPQELELDAAHCSQHELSLRDDSDEDTDMMSASVDLSCSFDAVRVHGHLEATSCK